MPDLKRDEAERLLYAFQAAAIDAYTQHDGPSELDAKREQLRAAVLARMAGKVPTGYVAIPKAAWDFLCGAGELDGCSFGERHPTRPGAFWWRSYISNMLAAAPESPR